jgi:hypothetical protein
MYHKKGGIPEQIQITRNLEKVEVWKTIFSIISTEPTLIVTNFMKPPTDLQRLGSELNQSLQRASLCSTVLLMLVGWNNTRGKGWKWACRYIPHVG